MTTNEELIAEASRLIADCMTYNFGTHNADKLAHEIAPKLVEALAALTAPPEGDARERLRKVVARGAFEDFADYPLDGENALVERVTDAIFAALPVLSRTTSPDAATEELDKVALDRLQELAEEAGYDKGFAAGWKSGGKTADLLAPKLRKAQAERDAALAAIERVRAAICQYPNYGARFAVEAALDGAPEPEWEREYRRVRPDGVPVFNAVFETMPLLDDYYTAEYRTVSPWLPVEGESKP